MRQHAGWSPYSAPKPTPSFQQQLKTPPAVPSALRGTSSLAHYPQQFAKTSAFSVPGGACGSGWFQVLQAPLTPLLVARPWEPVLRRTNPQPAPARSTLKSTPGPTPRVATLGFGSCLLPGSAAQPTRAEPIPTTSVHPWSQPVVGASKPRDAQSAPLSLAEGRHDSLSALPVPAPTLPENMEQEEFLNEADDSSSSSEEFDAGTDSSEEWGAPRRRPKKHHLEPSTEDIDRPFKCRYPQCKKAYSRKTDLQIHERNHTGERPFPCTYPRCNMAFKSKAVMVTHLRLHTGEKPFACPLPGCGARFTQRSNYSRHTKLHTANPGVIRITARRSREEGAGTPSEAEV